MLFFANVTQQTKQQEREAEYEAILRSYRLAVGEKKPISEEFYVRLKDYCECNSWSNDPNYMQFSMYFNEEEQLPGMLPVAMIFHEFWRLTDWIYRW